MIDHSENTLYETQILLHGLINMLANCDNANDSIAFLTPFQLASILKPIERNIRFVMDLENIPAEENVDELRLAIRAAD